MRKMRNVRTPQGGFFFDSHCRCKGDSHCFIFIKAKSCKAKSVEFLKGADPTNQPEDLRECYQWRGLLSNVLCVF